MSPNICLVIYRDDDYILVDMGAGNLAPTIGKLISNLKAEGISSENIATFILTHGHPDHIREIIDSEGKPSFPNTRYIIWKDEWYF